MAVNNFNTCLSCKYFTDSGGPIGVCRRYPQFQNRSKMEWCGEHSNTLKLPVVEIQQFDEKAINKAFDDAYAESGGSLTVTIEPKKRGRKKKEASDVQTSE